MAHVSLTPTPVSPPIHVAPVVPLLDGPGPITAMHLEEIRRGTGADAAYVCGGLLATLTACEESTVVAYQGGPLGTIKRHATSKGDANKDAMMVGARASGFTLAGKAADALAILHRVLPSRGGVL